jgi:IS30 family transposase
MTPEQVRHVRDLLTHPENTVSSIARLLGVSRATIYKYVPELRLDEFAHGHRPDHRGAARRSGRRRRRPLTRSMSGIARSAVKIYTLVDFFLSDRWRPSKPADLLFRETREDARPDRDTGARQCP